MTSDMLDDASCWRITGARDPEAFFRAIPAFLPEATHVFLEGSPAPAVMDAVQPHVDPRPYDAPEGTYWSWPRNRRITLAASPALFAALTEVAGHHAEPEICTHLHVYRDAEPLLQWFDAFDDPILVSKAVPRDAVERFCLDVAGVLSDGAA